MIRLPNGRFLQSVFRNVLLPTNAGTADCEWPTCFSICRIAENPPTQHLSNLSQRANRPHAPRLQAAANVIANPSLPPLTLPHGHPVRILTTTQDAPHPPRSPNLANHQMPIRTTSNSRLMSQRSSPVASSHPISLCSIPQLPTTRDKKSRPPHRSKVAKITPPSLPWSCPGTRIPLGHSPLRLHSRPKFLTRISQSHPQLTHQMGTPTLTSSPIVPTANSLKVRQPHHSPPPKDHPKFDSHHRANPQNPKSQTLVGCHHSHLGNPNSWDRHPPKSQTNSPKLPKIQTIATTRITKRLPEFWIRHQPQQQSHPQISQQKSKPIPKPIPNPHHNSKASPSGGHP